MMLIIVGNAEARINSVYRDDSLPSAARCVGQPYALELVSPTPKSKPVVLLMLNMDHY